MINTKLLREIELRKCPVTITTTPSNDDTIVNIAKTLDNLDIYTSFFG